MASLVPPVDDEPSNTEEEEPPTKFEAAIEACGFGRFNYLQLSVSFLGIAATVFETSTMSYILPTAECDLGLTIMYKGTLNGITYGGMIASAVPWGFVADTMGRKKVLVYGLIIGGIFDLCSACSQDVVQLITFKWFGGVVNCGPFAVIMSYLSEFHSRKHRSGIMMLVGLMKTVALLILPILAYVTLPYHLEFHIHSFKFHTWQFFVLLTAIPGLIGGILLAFFPESPKFLMSQGRNEEALAAFKTIYAWNKKADRESYPVKHLFEEAPEQAARRAARENKSGCAKFRKRFIDGLKQMKPMFSLQYLLLSVLVYIMDFCLLTGQNSVRLWLPQIFASIVDYENKKKGGGPLSMCQVLNYNVNRTAHFNQVDEAGHCDVHIAPESYTNNIIVGFCSFCVYILTCCIVFKVGNKIILNVSLAISSVTGTSLYWSKSNGGTLTLSSIFVAASSIAATTVISTSVDIFPTSMRTMIVIMIMTFGRVGSLLGNIILPLFMSIGCEPPFIMIGGTMLIATIISFFLPYSSKEDLK